MMVVYNSIAVCAAFALVPVILLTWKLVSAVWIKPRELEKQLREQGFNGNPYRLPMGDFITMTTLLKEAHSKPIEFSHDIAPRIIPEVLHLIQKYGKNSLVWYGPQPAIFVHDIKLVMEACQDVNLFHKPSGSDLDRLLTPGIISSNGAKWEKHRKIITPAFRMEKLKLMVPAFYESTSEMLGKWEEIVSPQGWGEIDVWPSIMAWSSDAISRTAFGSNYKEARSIFELQEEQAEYCLEAFMWSSFIPGWRFVPTKRNRRMSEIEKVINSSIERIVSNRINAVKAGKSCENDLLGILLESNFQEIDEHGIKESGMTFEEVISECKLFHFAGQETTSLLLVWTMILLSRHDEWQNRARDEVLQHFGNSRPDFDGLNRLKVVNWILHEALRLYPPVPVNGRVTASETKLGDKTVPAKVLILLETVVIHTDPEIWGEDAKEFKPDRFSEGVLNASKGQHAFFPFGAGPRLCIGQNFSMLEAKMALAMILPHFSFELSPSYAHGPRAVLTLKPQYGAHLILRKL